jgi:prophage regulatory protein
MVDHVNAMPTILRRKQVEARVGLSRSTIYDRIKAGSFPAPFSLGAKAVGWLQSEIELWITQRARGTRRTPPSPENKSAA